MLRNVLVLVLVLFLSPAWASGTEPETANRLYVQAYQLEESDPAAAIATYQRILEEWPDSEAALRAIDRIEHLEAPRTAAPDELPAPEVTFHTDRGEVVVELFPEEAPRSVAAVQEAAAKGVFQGRTLVSFGGVVRISLPLKEPVERNALVPVTGTVWLAHSEVEPWLGISTVDLPKQENLTVIGRVVEGLGIVEQLREAKVEFEEVDRTVEIESVEVDGWDVVLETGAGRIVFTLFDDEHPESPGRDLRRHLDLAGYRLTQSQLRAYLDSAQLPMEGKRFMSRDFRKMLGDALTTEKRRRASNFHARLRLERGNVALLQDQTGSALAFITKDAGEYTRRTTPSTLWFVVGRVREGMEVVDEIEAKYHLEDRSRIVPAVTATIQETSIDLRNTRSAREVAPECSDPEVVKTARKVVLDLLWQQSAPGRALAALTGHKPSTKEEMGDFAFADVRTVATYPNGRGRSCRASVYVTRLSRRYQVPADYEVELLDNQPGRFNVNLLLHFDRGSWVN